MGQLSGKFIRTATSMLPIDEYRKGECIGCGACCKFVYRCPFLEFEQNGKKTAICSIYRFRPPMCRKYPRTESEQTHHPCGYYFGKKSSN